MKTGLILRATALNYSMHGKQTLDEPLLPCGDQTL
jgi:hypothetical protein